MRSHPNPTHTHINKTKIDYSFKYIIVLIIHVVCAIKSEDQLFSKVRSKMMQIHSLVDCHTNIQIITVLHIRADNDTVTN